MVNPALRANFVNSSIKILEDYGFDGLDIDYEYPGNYDQARGYVDLLRELRHGLDAHAHRMGIHYKYPLTVSRLRDTPYPRLMLSRLLPPAVPRTMKNFWQGKWTSICLFGILW